MISPAGFERFLAEAAELFSGPTDPDAEELEHLAARYDLSFQLEMVNELIDRHGLTGAVRYD